MKLVIIENKDIFKITEEQEAVFRYIQDNYCSTDEINIIDVDDIKELSALMKEEF